MPITQRDVFVLLTMSLAVISMSLVFPSLGLATTNVDTQDIPELNISTSQVQFSGDFPTAPGSPSTGDLEYVTGANTQLNRDWIEGDTSGGIEIFVDGKPTFVNAEAEVVLNFWDAGTAVHTETFTFNQTNEPTVYINNTEGIELEITPTTISADKDVVRYEVVSRLDSNDGWLSNLPLVGGAIDVASATASTLGWFVEIAVWGLLYVFDFIANAALLVTDTLVYFVSLLIWLSTTYGSIVSSASSWVSLFVALPGVILSAVLGKFIVVGIKILPTT